MYYCRYQVLLTCCLLFGGHSLSVNAEPSAGTDSAATAERMAGLQQITDKNAATFPDVKVITARELVTELEQDEGEQLVLVDVRSPKEMGVSIIPGALTKMEYEKEHRKYADAKIVTYCAVGYRSARYSQVLQRRGVASRSLEGGIIAWCQEGRELANRKGETTSQVYDYGSKRRLFPGDYTFSE